MTGDFATPHLSADLPLDAVANDEHRVVLTNIHHIVEVDHYSFGLMVDNRGVIATHLDHQVC